MGPHAPRGHEIVPKPGTVYSIGPSRAGREADLRNSLHYPVEALCAECGERVTCDGYLLGRWRHEPRPVS